MVKRIMILLDDKLHNDFRRYCEFNDVSMQKCLEAFINSCVGCLSKEKKDGLGTEDNGNNSSNS